MRPIRALAAALAFAVAGAGANTGPCDDFYGYVNRGWLAATELPADRARVGTFDTLRTANNRLLERALAELARAPDEASTPGMRLVAADFAAGMDEDTIERRGVEALAPWLDRIDALRDRAALPALLAALTRLQLAVPLGAFVGPDAKDKRRHALVLRQGGLGLPDRGDYSAADERAQRLRAAYRLYARRLLEGVGAAPTDDALARLVDFERALADASLPRVLQRDPNALYNPFDAAALAAAAPGLDWAAWLAAYGAPPGLRFVVGEPAFAAAMARLAAEAELGVWRDYLRVRLLDGFARRLPQAFARAAFDFHDAALRGLAEPPPRAERVVMSIAAGPVAEGLGQVYVARRFSPVAQQRALQLVDDVRAAMRARIERLDWMSAPTKARALAKLDAIVAKVGAPPRWRAYEGLVFRPDDHAGNALRAAEWHTRDRLADLARPVDRGRWNTSPHVVNAFAGALNDIVFPAGILQPPFFDERADDAVNFGGIGAVIAHELTHHFDDRGRLFDADGNLADWWTPADAAAYRARADRVAALYGGYEAVPGLRIDGRLTLGENISDLSGLQIAWDALQIAIARQPVQTLENAQAAERFFVANATIWRSKQRPEAVATQLRTDPHSPGPFRVLGPLSNLPAFAATYGCKAGSPMVATEPITVW